MNRVANALMLMCFLIVFGTIGYVVVEGWKPADGLFMTVITLSTVGYGETNELTANGRNFTSLLIFLCLVSMTYWSASLTSFIVEQELNGHFARKRVIKMISQLKEHVVICGSGPIAKALIERLTRKRIPVVLVDENKEELDGLKRRFRKLHVLVGSPTNEMILAEANVIDAKTVGSHAVRD